MQQFILAAKDDVIFQTEVVGFKGDVGVQSGEELGDGGGRRARDVVPELEVGEVGALDGEAKLEGWW